MVEAGHRCAIPTCRYIEVDVHHIIPWETCKEHTYENLIAICPNCHRRAGRGEIDRKSMRLYKANLRFAHDKYSQFEMDTLFELYRLPIGRGIAFPVYLCLLIKRLLDSQLVAIHAVGAGIVTGGLKATPDLLVITEQGRRFIESFGLDVGN